MSTCIKPCVHHTMYWYERVDFSIVSTAIGANQRCRLLPPIVLIKNANSRCCWRLQPLAISLPLLALKNVKQCIRHAVYKYDSDESCTVWTVNDPAKLARSDPCPCSVTPVALSFEECLCLVVAVVGSELVDTHAIDASAGPRLVPSALVVARSRLLGRLGGPAEAFWSRGKSFNGGIATTIN